jgi:hypothetical protein
MKQIIEESTINNWIDATDNRLKLLQNAKDFIHREYYKRDSISYYVEECFQDALYEKIKDAKSKRELLLKMLEQVNTSDNIEIYGSPFRDSLISKLPENLRKEFFNFVYEI